MKHWLPVWREHGDETLYCGLSMHNDDWEHDLATCTRRRSDDDDFRVDCPVCVSIARVHGCVSERRHCDGEALRSGNSEVYIGRTNVPFRLGIPRED